jgi:hypothetical protein
MQTRGLGEILHGNLFRELIDENFRLYLLSFLADPRRIYGGTVLRTVSWKQEQMERALTNRLVQVLLALSCFAQKRRIPRSATVAMASFGAKATAATHAGWPVRHRGDGPSSKDKTRPSTGWP